MTPQKSLPFRAGVVLIIFTFCGLSTGVWTGWQSTRAIKAACKQQQADRVVIMDMLNLLTAPRTLADNASPEQVAFQDEQNQEAQVLRKQELTKLHSLNCDKFTASAPEPKPVRVAPLPATGATGLSGEQGPQGLTGPVGPVGDEGPQGIAGPPGADGRNGLNGIDGRDGRDGATGETGATGAKGDKGDKGDVGETGPPGEPGPQGPPGPQGEPASTTTTEPPTTTTTAPPTTTTTCTVCVP